MHYQRWYHHGDLMPNVPAMGRGSRRLTPDEIRKRNAEKERRRLAREEKRDRRRTAEQKKRHARRRAQQKAREEKQRLALEGAHEQERQQEIRRKARKERAYNAQFQWRERNRDYVRRQAAVYKKKIGKIPGLRNGQPWTSAETAIAMRNDLSITEMSYMLGRSYSSVCGHREWIRAGNGSASLARAERNATIRQLHAEGWHWSKIADELGCNRDAVRYAIRGRRQVKSTN